MDPGSIPAQARIDALEASSRLFGISIIGPPPESRNFDILPSLHKRPNGDPHYTPISVPIAVIRDQLSTRTSWAPSLVKEGKILRRKRFLCVCLRFCNSTYLSQTLSNVI